MHIYYIGHILLESILFTVTDAICLSDRTAISPGIPRKGTIRVVCYPTVCMHVVCSRKRNVVHVPFIGYIHVVRTLDFKKSKNEYFTSALYCLQKSS